MTSRKGQRPKPSRSESTGMSRRSVLVAAGIIGLGAAAGVFAWWPRGGVSHAYSLAPESVLPASIRQTPRSVRDAYRFAVANRDILRQIPCYCGCGTEHRSNADCYIKDVYSDGSIVFDPMSFG